MGRLLRPQVAVLIVVLVCTVLVSGSRSVSAHGSKIFRQPSSGPQVNTRLTPENLSTINLKVIIIKQVIFTTDGGWLVLYGANGYSAEGMPTELTDVLDELNQDKKEIHFVSLTADGGWVVVSGKLAGAANGFNSKGLPKSALDKLNSLNENGLDFTDVAFSPDNEWVILYGANRYAASKNIPSDLTDKLDELIKATRSLKQVTFTSSGKWVVLYNDNRYATSGVGKSITDELKKVNSQNFRLTRLAFAMPFASSDSSATPEATSDTSAGDAWVVLYGANGVIYSEETPSTMLDRLKDLNSGVE
jgi:hypothetical protein